LEDLTLEDFTLEDLTLEDFTLEDLTLEDLTWKTDFGRLTYNTASMLPAHPLTPSEEADPAVHLLTQSKARML